MSRPIFIVEFKFKLTLIVYAMGFVTLATLEAF